MFDEYYLDDKMTESYKAAKYYADNYNDTGVVLLISDDTIGFGDDDNEIVLGHNGYGADVIAIVEIA